MQYQASMMQGAVRWTIVAIIAIATTSVAQAQSSRAGARLGIDFDVDELFLGGQLTVPISTMVEFYPSIEIYTPDRGSLIGFNGDFKVRLPTEGSILMYAGGGLGILSRSVGDNSNTDLGANIFFGIESRVGRVHPVGEARVKLHDGSRFQLIGGLNFVLGG
jgi:hypothetical protein